MSKRSINRTEVSIIGRKFNISMPNFSIDHEGCVHVQGDVNIKYMNLNRLPFRFGRVDGNFNCSGINLTSLKGAPAFVQHDFLCASNLLTSLDYGPMYVGGNYDCSSNKLENLNGLATIIGRDLNCKHNKLKTLLGSPKDFFGKFDCSHNQLTDLSGMTERFMGDLYIYANNLKNLKGFKEIDGTVHIDATTRSINTGIIDPKNMKIQIRQHAKHIHDLMPTQITDNQHHMKIVLKYQRYYEVWSDNDELNLDYFQMLIEDIEDGLL
jgi:virulence-associated protein VapD